MLERRSKGKALRKHFFVKARRYKLALHKEDHPFNLNVPRLTLYNTFCFIKISQSCQPSRDFPFAKLSLNTL